VQGAAGATLGQNRDLGMSDDAFARHRRLLFTVAYEMLGSASGAGDVVQETWLRWADVDHASVREPRAYLVRIVTRQALNRLRTLARRREDYVGEWLPEPLVTSPDVAADVELARACRWRCSRCSRRSARQSAPSSCFARCSTPRMRDRRGGRQIICRRSPDRPPGSRARRCSTSTGVGHRDEQKETLDRFLAAIRHGDLQGLLDVLAPDVVVLADGGGVVAAARLRSKARSGWPASCSEACVPWPSRQRLSGSTGHPPSASTPALRSTRP
jgi:DNA-directed RNA polymerase specialized sigma24 family protein